MRPIAIDTNAYTSFKHGDADIRDVLRHAPSLLLPVTVLGELLAGFAAGSREQLNRAELTQFIGSPRVKVLTAGSATADLYALVYATLRRKGQPIPANDLWIAASCLEQGAALLSLDVHFQNIEGLRVGRCLNDFIP
ncbi:MAG: type II toxin-antitoxin system VapC family toxin [Rhodoferax sp.]|jgi:predicted nucleic acid-binding protein|nr:type II toxin-antitoxin system VapC family toxin [Rhodoferax sp.]